MLGRKLKQYARVPYENIKNNNNPGLAETTGYLLRVDNRDNQ